MKSLSKSLVTALLVAASILAFTLGVCAPNMSLRVVGPPAFSQELSFVQTAVSDLRLRNVDGSVVVHTHNKQTIEITVKVRTYARTRDAEEKARTYGASLVRVFPEDTGLSVITEQGERPEEVDVLSDFSVLVPEGTNLDLQSANGNVWVSAGCGAVNVQGRNTDIEIVEPRGKVVAYSTNGRIKVIDATKDTAIETVNGSVYAHMQSGALKAETTNGAIVAHVLNPDVQECDLTTQNGGITLVLSEGCSAALEARTARGVVSSDFDIETSEGIQQRRHVRGIIGKGDTELQMDTLNGNIWIARSAS